MTKDVAVFIGGRSDGEPLQPVIDALGKRAVKLIMDSPPVETEYDATLVTASATQYVARRLNEWKSKLLVILGDRYEALGAAVAAHLMGVPIVHLSGGDVTLGSRDDGTRNAITKLASVHCATCEMSAERLLNMGEELWRIHVTGCAGVDRVMRTTIWNRDETLSWLGFAMSSEYVLVLFQPATAADYLAEGEALIEALEAEPPDRGIVVGSFNSDPGAQELEEMFAEAFTQRHLFRQLVHVPAERFLSLVRHSRIVVGNSSSLLYEVPSLKRPAVLVGERQLGRGPVAQNIIETRAVAEEITHAMRCAVAIDCRAVTNPFGDGFAGERIARVVTGALAVDRNKMLRKAPVRDR